MEKIWEYYKLMRSNILLQDVQLESLNCSKNESMVENLALRVQLAKKSKFDENLEELDEIEVFLKVNIDFEDEAGGEVEGPFTVLLEYKGIFSQQGSLNKQNFIEQSENIAVPLLLPYAREAISDVITKMGYPVYHLPTLDIIDALSANVEQEHLKD